jgi:hypothetical protein
MKTNTKFHKSALVVLLILMAGVFTHCVNNPTSNVNERGPAGFGPAPTGPTVRSPEQILSQTQAEIGVRNHEQLLQTFSVLTGVNSADNRIMTVYRQVENTLPTENDPKSYQASQQVAVSRLAAEFCFVLIEDANLAAMRSQLWPGFNFTIPLGNFNLGLRQQIARGFINGFWGEGLLSLQDEQAAEDEMLELMAELAAGEVNNAANLRRVIRGACTAALSSGHVVLF